ncbi:hypothetical protein [Ruminococcus sp.]|uniref:hypothetical protein n=1 Tax=Ruminococcus sp. TaxID=41978 RepID=UPI0025CE74FB|nr:hypothetical protein [Ruminococcus sp.]
MNLENEYKKAIAERETIIAELKKLTGKEIQKTHHINLLQNHYEEEKRRNRTLRLIEHGIILESLIPNVEEYSNEQIQHILKIAFANLPGGIKGIHFPAVPNKYTEKTVL